MEKKMVARQERNKAGVRLSQTICEGTRRAKERNRLSKKEIESRTIKTIHRTGLAS
jgi:hypothetical protein